MERKRCVVQLIKRYLKIGVMENGVVIDTEEGSPQGGNLFCFRHTKNGEDQYRPKQCDVDFEKVEDSAWRRCTLKKNEKGNYT